MYTFVEDRIIEQKRYMVAVIISDRNQKRKSEILRSAKGVLINLYKVYANGILN